MKTDSQKLRKIVLWEPDAIKPYERNHKLHPADQIEQLKKSINTTGLNYPIMIDRNGVIIAGHGRFEALKALGWQKIPVDVRDDLTDAEAQAARISDNVTTSVRYDTRALQDDLRALFGQDIDFNADDIGLSQKEQDLLMQSIDVPDVEAIMDDPADTLREQSDENREHVTQADHDVVKIADVFGFKSMSRSDARRASRMLAGIEGATGKSGMDAIFHALEAGIAA